MTDLAVQRHIQSRIAGYVRPRDVDAAASILLACRLMPVVRKQDVDRAGRLLLAGPGTDPSVQDEQYAEAYVMAHMWRGAHQYLVSQLQMIIFGRVRDLGIEALIAGRLKRIPTIVQKLRRLRRFGLGDLQDIAGLRVVVPRWQEAIALAQALRRSPPEGFSEIRYQDRISDPDPSGYRSIHIVYRFDADDADPPSSEGLKIELQIRTRLQQLWATVEEIVGSARREALKSGEGNPDWLRFFELAADVLARREGTPRTRKIVREGTEVDTEIAAVKRRLNVFDRVSGYNVVQQLPQGNAFGEARIFVVTLNLASRSLFVRPFTADQLGAALAAYQEAEREHLSDADFDTVLITADSADELEKMYPNYFADSEEFLRLIYSAEEIAEIDRRSALVKPPQP
jgi:ppGpp synthetase/RelA/SpoT-type nucleotidyltranferase